MKARAGRAQAGRGPRGLLGGVRVHNHTRWYSGGTSDLSTEFEQTWAGAAFTRLRAQHGPAIVH